LKKPIPKIESPGFPGTQWNEFYWKDQTVMLLMQEADFPDGKNPEFCAKLVKEETGKWRLKMEQFKRWLEKEKITLCLNITARGRIVPNVECFCGTQGVT
jgi:hypothetical protein